MSASHQPRVPCLNDGRTILPVRRDEGKGPGAWHMMDTTMPHHVSRSRFSELVEKALAEMPQQFAQVLEEVPVEIRDRPTRKQLKSLGLDENELLLGLYHGRPRTERSVHDSGIMPDVIYIFQ